MFVLTEQRLEGMTLRVSLSLRDSRFYFALAEVPRRLRVSAESLQAGHFLRLISTRSLFSSRGTEPDAGKFASGYTGRKSEFQFSRHAG